MKALSRLGVIGAGNMGSAIVRGVAGGDSDLSEVHVFDVDASAGERLADQHGAIVEPSIEQLVDTSDFIIVAVKPDVVPKVLSSVAAENVKLASIAAGVTLETLNENLPSDSEIIRVMPNTPAQVGEGMSFLAPGPRVSDEFLEALVQVFEDIGRVSVVDEQKMDAVTALSGSGPAYVFYFLEALTEAGVFMGLGPEEARQAAEQTVLGAARLACERPETSPADLRAEVSSPGGTTVEAIKHLDEQGAKGMIQEAVDRARQKSKRLDSSD